jgi:hypothetical protein
VKDKDCVCLHTYLLPIRGSGPVDGGGLYAVLNTEYARIRDNIPDALCTPYVCK